MSSQKCYVLFSTFEPAAVPDGIMRVCRSAAVSHVDRREYFGSFAVGIQVELDDCPIGVGQHADAAGRQIGIVCIVHVQRVDQQFKKPDHVLNVLQPDAAR